MKSSSRRATLALGLAALAAAPAVASEGGASFYLLGSGGPEAGVMPPLQGIFLSNEVYYYGASPKVSREFVVGGNVVAGLDTKLPADFVSLAWVPTTHFLGGTLMVGGALPVAAPIVDVDVVLTGPLGQQRSFSRHDTAVVIGDPIATAALGWAWGKLHLQAAGTANIPVGTYREGALANVAFHRWVLDTSLALSWNDPKAGWDLSTKAGLTFNGTNKTTDYNTGTEFHLEASVEKTLSPDFSAGVQGYWFRQLTADSGSGAVLGPYKGEVLALGPTVALHTELGRSPTTIRLQAFREFDATNRMQGTSVMFTISLPLSMKIPPHH